MGRNAGPCRNQNSGRNVGPLSQSLAPAGGTVVAELNEPFEIDHVKWLGSESGSVL